MTLTNATLESLRAVTAISGEGESVLGAESISVPLPIELITPKSYRVETDRQRGVQNDAMIRMERLAFEVMGHELSVGDRISIRRDRIGGVLEAFELRDIVEQAAGHVVELVLAVRDDEPQEGGA